MSDPLFQSVEIGSLQLKNRIFMPAMHMNMCRSFTVTKQLVNFYHERAKGGAALISVGYATVDELSGNEGNIGAHDDQFIPGLRELSSAIHDGGAKAVVQLNHSGRYNHSFFLGGKKPIAPSPIASRLTGETPREMEPEDIERVIEKFSDAAHRVKESGYDMVEILAGTGYLISEFLSPLTNKRQDEYGGSFENRMRFGLEVVQAVKSRIGKEYPLLVRINGNDFMEGGVGRRELQEFAESLVNVGVDALCINVGWHEAQVPQIVTKVPRGVFSYLAQAIRQRVAVPVIASHRINDPGIARTLIENGACDMVAMGRALIADPYLPEKARVGDEESILHCVGCGQGCFDNLITMKPVECLCNPRAGHEMESVFELTGSPKKVMVVGGGAAGMNAALAAAEKGHRVRLYEKGMVLGGQLYLAGAPPGRAEFHVLSQDLVKSIGRSNISVVLNTAVDGELLLWEGPDSVILATGGEPITPDIPGVDLDHVLQAWDVLSGEKKTGERVVIIGGGAVGVEVALMVAEQGTMSADDLKFLLINGAESPEELQRLAVTGSKDVTLVEIQDKLGENFGKSTRWSMLQDVKRYGVRTHLEAKVVEITKDGVVVDGGGGQELIAADSVILAVGTKAYNPLKKVADELSIPCEVVGDARAAGTVLDATHQGFKAGKGIQ